MILVLFLLLAAAFVLFLIAAAGVPSRINFIALGLALVTLAEILNLRLIQIG